MGDWIDYRPSNIDLTHFLVTWLPGLRDDGLLVGLNRDVIVRGPEVHAAVVLAKLSGDFKLAWERTRGIVFVERRRESMSLNEIASVVWAPRRAAQLRR
jgi:hypothetical protein